MRMKPKIVERELGIETKLIRNFLEDGDKVKVTVNFRGRENAHPELGRAVLEEVGRRLDGIGSVERMPVLEGRSMHMIMSPSPQKPKPQTPAPPPAAPLGS